MIRAKDGSQYDGMMSMPEEEFQALLAEQRAALASLKEEASAAGEGVDPRRIIGACERFMHAHGWSGQYVGGWGCRVETESPQAATSQVAARPR